MTKVMAEAQTAVNGNIRRVAQAISIKDGPAFRVIGEDSLFSVKHCFSAESWGTQFHVYLVEHSALCLCGRDAPTTAAVPAALQ